MIFLCLVLALTGFLAGYAFGRVFFDRALGHMTEHQAQERAAWVAERRDLNNRIQVPEAAPFMDPHMQQGPPPLQHVPFDDDDAFLKSQEEAPEWP